MITSRKAFITGIKGKKLTTNEINFLKKHKPWGVILFSRNIYTLKQTKLLTQSIRKIFKDKKYPILIDEEGGRVSRLYRLIDTSMFSAKYFGDLFCNDIKKFYLYYNIYIKQISYLMNLLGININTVPVLDIFRKKSHKVIGDRSYSSDQKIVSNIGDFCINKFHKNRIGTVIKHIPGHGLSKEDSHIRLPVVNNKYRELLNKDFHVFKNKKSLFSMTSHIIYKNIDELYPATHSIKIINLIRKKIAFKNLILSDDISMKALKYSISKNTHLAFTAGCNLVMHCNGNMREMIIVAKNSPYIDNFILKKTYQFYDIIR